MNARAFRFVVWLAVLVGSLAGTAPVSASSSASGDSLVIRKLKVRSTPPIGGAQVRVTPWPIAGSAEDMNEKARAVAVVFEGDSLGRGLSSWIESHPGRIEEFHGSSYSIVLTEYWAFRNTAAFQSGSLAAFGYLLGCDEEPTIERLTWTIGPSSGVDTTWLASLSDRLVTALSPHFGKPERPAPDRIMEPGSWYWREMTQFNSPSGILYVFRQPSADGAPLDSLVVMHSSARLQAEDRPDTSFTADEEREEVGLPPLEVLTEVTHALARPSPQLAVVLRASGSKQEDLPTVQAALARARGRGVSSGERDLLRYGVHLWLRSCRDLPGWAVGDSAALRPIRDALKEFGIRLERTHDGAWCYDGALAESLAMRAGQNRWTDLAFIELLDRGWESPCGLCGWDRPFGPDQFKPVIEHGEAYLKAHPKAEIADQVGLRVAEAHETAWSLSKAAWNDEYIDASRYRLAASKHREEALQLYAKVSESRPDLVDDDLRGRLRRMRLDIDTNFHRYWCVWD